LKKVRKKSVKYLEGEGKRLYFCTRIPKGNAVIFERIT